MKNKNMKKFLKTILSGILCALLTLTIFLTSIFTAIGFNMNMKSIKKYIISSGYSNLISDKVLEKLYNLADVNNLPHEIFNILGTNDIYEYMVLTLTDEVNKKYITDINEKRELLEKEIKDYVLANMELTEVQKESLDKNVKDFVNECITVYNSNIKLNFLEKVSSYIKLIDRYYFMVIAASIFVDILVFYILIKIQKWKHRGYRYSLYSLLSVELIMIILAGYLYFNNIINRLNVVTKDLNILITTILNGMLLNIYISIIMLGILIFLNIYFYNKKKRKALGGGVKVE